MENFLANYFLGDALLVPKLTFKNLLYSLCLFYLRETVETHRSTLSLKIFQVLWNIKNIPGTRFSAFLLLR